MNLGATKLYNYYYDQLNRIAAMDVYNGLNPGAGTFTPVSISDYAERISYDPNGNILSYQRNGDAARTSMDNLSYFYKANTNQLHKVSDAAPDVAPADYSKYNDLKQGQLDNNYQYDAIGNLVSDASEGITNINWNVYGKIMNITKSGAQIGYLYDASGNRIIKQTASDTTVYVRDATGNVLSVYEKKPGGQLVQTEMDLYGSSRLGMAVQHLALDTTIVLSGGFGTAIKSSFTRGEKVYELANHLGNVLVTISDKKLGVDQNSDGVIDYYTADVQSAQDYYPFGFKMPDRTYNASNYRYGFNGKEEDDEVKGDGSSMNFGARIYDPRIGRWSSVDKLEKGYPSLSPYNYVSNAPLSAVDPDGNLIIFINGFWGWGTGASSGGNKNYWSYSNRPGGWADDAKARIGDYHARYYDGSSGGLWKGNPQREILPSQRVLQGYNMGKKEAASIIASLQRDPNDPSKITESIKFITNSMGTAYERGFSAALVEYVDNYNLGIRTHNAQEEWKAAGDSKYKPNYKKEITGFNIEFTVDLAAFQGDQIWYDPKANDTYYMRSKEDWVAGYEGSRILGTKAKEIGLDSKGEPKSKGHHASFFPANDLPKSTQNGTTKKDINQNN